MKIFRDRTLAEDAVQAALITAWIELRTLREPSRFEPWLHRILTHACYAEARHRTRWSEGLRIMPVAGTYGPDDYLTVDDRDLLERAFRRLTVQQRAVLVFHHYLGLTISEVAERTGLPVGTAKSRLHHATRALKASIEVTLGHPDFPGATGMTASRDPDSMIHAFLAKTRGRWTTRSTTPFVP